MIAIDRRFLLRILVAALAFWATANKSALAIPEVQAQSAIKDVTDFSASGAKIGASGYWFANFDAGSPVSRAPVDQNDANALPDWILVDFDPESDSDEPDYSFSITPGPEGPDATSVGGQADYNTIVLPDGSRGRSGQLVDVGVGTNNNGTVIKELRFGPGSPSSLLVHIVLDNAPRSAGTVVDRVRVTHRNPTGGIKARAAFENLTAGSNGIADVYTFRLDGVEPGGSIAVQLRSASDESSPDTALAGFAFDAIAFPPASKSARILWPVLGTVLFIAIGTWTAVRIRRSARAASVSPSKG